MTKYELDLKEGKTVPITQLEATMLECLVSEILKEGKFTKEDKECVIDCIDELEFIFKDNLFIINELKKIMDI